MNNKLAVGDKVMWRGGFGRDPAREVTIEAIELCESEHEKYGIDVQEVFLSDKNRAVFTLNTGNWAYGTQISQMRG
jgi:hypothetical protein